MKTKAGAAELTRCTKEMEKLNSEMIEMCKKLKKIKAKDRDSVVSLVQEFEKNRLQWIALQGRITSLVGMEKWMDFE